MQELARARGSGGQADAYFREDFDHQDFHIWSLHCPGFAYVQADAIFVKTLTGKTFTSGVYIALGLAYVQADANFRESSY